MKAILSVEKERPRVGFYALRNKYRAHAASTGTVLLSPRVNCRMEGRVAFSTTTYGGRTLTVLFVALVLVMAYFTLANSLTAFGSTPCRVRLRRRYARFVRELSGAPGVCSKATPSCRAWEVTGATVDEFFGVARRYAVHTTASGLG